MSGRSSTARSALLAWAGLMASCGSPPVNNPRFWDERATRAAPDAEATDPGAGGSDVDPSATGGAGGGEAQGGNGSGGSDGKGGSIQGGAGGRGGSPATDARGSDTRPADGGARTDVAPNGIVSGCTLQATVTTATTGNEYAPRNVGAIWIADSAGRFVKTLQLWAARRISKLPKWSAATSAAGVSRDTTDAVTGATSRTHVVRAPAWDCTDFMKMTVPTGAYQMCVEMNESNGGSQSTCVRFMHAGEAWRVLPPNATYFRSMSLVYTPRTPQ